MMQEVADYIDDCITDAGRPAPAVVGHSLGGLTGLMIAARAPQEVGKLMVVDAVPFIGPIDRKSAVSGKRVSGRVDLGGRRIIQKTHTREHHTQSTVQKSH